MKTRTLMIQAFFLVCSWAQFHLFTFAQEAPFPEQTIAIPSPEQLERMRVDWEQKKSAVREAQEALRFLQPNPDGTLTTDQLRNIAVIEVWGGLDWVRWEDKVKWEGWDDGTPEPASYSSSVCVSGPRRFRLESIVSHTGTLSKRGSESGTYSALKKWKIESEPSVQGDIHEIDKNVFCDQLSNASACTVILQDKYAEGEEVRGAVMSSGNVNITCRRGSERLGASATWTLFRDQETIGIQ